MINLHLYGEMASRYGDLHRLNVNSFGAAMRLMDINYPGFKKAISVEEKYGIVKGDLLAKQRNELFLNEINMPIGDDDYHLVPEIMGAGGNSFLSVITGALLIAASWWAGGAAGWAYLGAQGYAAATGLFYMGSSLILSGVAGMFTQAPSFDNLNRGNAEDKPSYNFNGPVNTVESGRTMPVMCGNCWVGSIVGSFGWRTTSTVDPGFIYDETDELAKVEEINNRVDDYSGGR